SKLIKEAISKEIGDMNFYKNLSNTITDIEDKKVLIGISMDEEKHSKILKELYYILNNEYPDVEGIEEEILPNFLENLYNAIIDETKAVEFYRVLLFALENSKYKNMITEIIFDEQNHAAKLNYLYSKNK
ncbi:MAG: ferritin family protein, partial [Lachnospirales bacterium]